MEGCKDARAVKYEPFIYPCFFVSPELTFTALLISFGLIRTTATLGVVVGVLVDRLSTNTAFFGGSCYRLQGSKQLFDFSFYHKKINYSKAKSNRLFDSVGVGWGA